MPRRAIPALALILALAAIISGCVSSEDKDAEFARSVIDAVYAGSLSSINDSLTPEMQAAPPQMIAAQGAALLQKFGAVQSLTLKSTEQAQGMTVRVWTVTAERGAFDMKLVVSKDGKLAGLWF